MRLTDDILLFKVYMLEYLEKFNVQETVSKIFLRVESNGCERE